ncbi:hypothetical protein COCC4DRAFT_60056 [Bipolaris maydis ATCC 48331]|uniref:Uncharacterized protein n=2 Tax=Cochliobolus heterostrophus TaxID=5016 RepID=M2UTD2_COCH5|nr:uncharacterized protein COCC4DRAFT_60056 [Bipolaris maydis ATCC 48331]EMD91132.1 hypothetical protein COCHEDRAFT_1030866 [Bipolaris maydis C5]ENI05787.1 hypothetical protein COCC4DRAFT_60056 [Bipolaris maydis ATCC 48331]KAJ6205087.1 hypothetical protein PSV09DRAFT_1030866 [Bipolaris maydis]
MATTLWSTAQHVWESIAKLVAFALAAALVSFFFLCMTPPTSQVEYQVSPKSVSRPKAAWWSASDKRHGHRVTLLLQVVDDGDTTGDTALFGVTDTVEGARGVITITQQSSSAAEGPQR